MIGQTTAPGARRQQILTEQIADLGLAVARLREELAYVNEPEIRQRVSAFIKASDFLRVSDDVVSVQTEPRPGIADQLNDLLKGIRALEVPARDPLLGPTLTLERLEQTTGIIAIRIINALDTAELLGWMPAEPDLPDRFTANISRSEVGSLLVPIAERLDAVIKSLDDLQRFQANEQGIAAQEKSLIEFYVGTVRVEINIARMQLVIGDRSIDFAGLTRVVETIAELTRNFISTLRGWDKLVSTALVVAAETIGKGVRRAASGVKTAINWVVREQRKARAARAAAHQQPPADFDLEEAKRMILAGETPPVAWTPFITELDLGYSDFASLTPVRNLAQLISLGLRGTQVRDLTPLTGLRRIQTLDLGGTAVEEVQPLSHLVNLETLVLWDTSTTDITALAELKGLQSLDLSSTDVNDISALANLRRLQILYLLGTKVEDLSPLSKLRSLRILSLMGTPVTKLDPLENLTNLQVLYVDGTAVSDLVPLANLNKLRNLDLRRTGVTDLSPLASLINLQNLSLTSGEYRGLDLLGDLANKIRWDD